MISCEKYKEEADKTAKIEWERQLLEVGEDLSFDAFRPETSSIQSSETSIFTKIDFHR
jgi:hypothetical protein